MSEKETIRIEFCFKHSQVGMEVLVRKAGETEWKTLDLYSYTGPYLDTQRLETALEKIGRKLEDELPESGGE